MKSLLVAVALLGCGAGGGTVATTSEHQQRRGGGGNGAADIAAMRTLLDRYSPTGSAIVRMNETLPREFVFGSRTITLSNSGDFGKYFDDGAPENIADYMATAVHEVYHAVSFRLGYQLLQESGAKEGIDCEGLYAGGKPLLVRYSPTFPAREIAATYPANARMFRFSTYVSPSSDAQSTQTDGIFGLLDEWTAYHNGGRTLVDLWPWIRDEAPKSRQVYVNYRSRFVGVAVSHAELKAFILHYLLHARTHRPDVFRALLANESFRRAFAAADDAWNALLAQATALEPALAGIARERGAATTIFYRDDAFPAVQALLASEPYQRMLAELRR